MPSLSLILALALTSSSAALAGTVLIDAKGPAAPPAPAPAPRCHPNAHGAHRPTVDLSAADGLGFQMNLPYESILYYRGSRMGENAVPLSLEMDVRITENLTWANHYRFINFFEDDSTDTKVHLWTALFYHTGGLSIGPGFKFHRNNSLPSAYSDAIDFGLQALYDFGPFKIGAGYSYDIESEGHYVEAGISAPLKLTPKLTLTPAAEISYIDGWTKPVEGMSNASLRLTATYKLNPVFTIDPFIAWNIPLDATDNRYDDEFIIGGALQARF